MTFLDLDCDAADLALELWYAGDAPDLDSAAALASDLQGTLADYGAEYDLDCLELQLAAAYAAEAQPGALIGAVLDYVTAEASQ